jgi:predicted aldo/keto reductase-like oxidoreductase
MPCPSNVEIPIIFKLYNAAIISNNTKWSRLRYSGVAGLRMDQRANQCVECGQCMDLCPQGILITDWLKKAHALLAE